MKNEQYVSYVKCPLNKEHSPVEISWNKTNIFTNQPTTIQAFCGVCNKIYDVNVLFEPIDDSTADFRIVECNED